MFLLNVREWGACCDGRSTGGTQQQLGLWGSKVDVKHQGRGGGGGATGWVTPKRKSVCVGGGAGNRKLSLDLAGLTLRWEKHTRDAAAAAGVPMKQGWCAAGPLPPPFPLSSLRRRKQCVSHTSHLWSDGVSS